MLIVIPSLNEQAHIEDVIATLRADPACAEALIVVADGGSKDDTVGIVARIGLADPRVHAIPTDRPLGISASINAAVRKFARGRTWMVRIDAHAEYPERYGSRLVEKAQETGATAVVTPMRTKGAACFQVATAVASNSTLGNGGAAHRSTGRSGWVEHGHHALMRLDAYIASGGYDETFSHNEDAELDRRIANLGGRIWLAADLELVYYPRKTPRALFRQYFFYGRGRAMTFARHGGRRRLRQLVPLAIAPMVGAAALAPVFWPAVLPVLGWAGLCLGYGAWLGRKGPACAALSGIPAMIMHFAWSAGYWAQLLRGPRPGPFAPAVTAAHESA